jgi:hypothetical protein
MMTIYVEYLTHPWPWLLNPPVLATCPTSPVYRSNLPWLPDPPVLVI